MPIIDFSGNTFVAFVDICGFKELMRTPNRAWTALDMFYSCAYKELQEVHNSCRVEGILVSDSGILFVRNNQNEPEENLRGLLSAIKGINISMLENDFMLATSISYGFFQYKGRIEFKGIEKNAIFGNAYVSAYQDHEIGIPKIQPGQCRIIKEGLPPTLNTDLSNDNWDFIRQRRSDRSHYYYYWNLNDSHMVSSFEKMYEDSYQLKYQGMLKALKESRNAA